MDFMIAYIFNMNQLVAAEVSLENITITVKTLTTNLKIIIFFQCANFMLNFLRRVTQTFEDTIKLMNKFYLYIRD